MSYNENKIARAIHLLQTVTAALNGQPISSGPHAEPIPLSLRDPSPWKGVVLALLGFRLDETIAVETMLADPALRHAREAYDITTAHFQRTHPRKQPQTQAHTRASIDALAYELAIVEAGLIAYCDVARASDSAAALAFYRLAASRSEPETGSDG